MIGLIKTTMNGVKKLKIWEWSIFKICLVSFGLLLGTLLPDLMEVKWWIYGLIFVVTDIYLMIRIFRK